MNELKKCPFCGGRVAMNQDDEGYYVSCCEEGCVVMTNSYAEKEAAEKWNTRKPIERVIERLGVESNFFGGEPMGTLQKTYYCEGIKKAIEIIKGEVG